jgi:hypothetical protein
MAYIPVRRRKVSEEPRDDLGDRSADCGTIGNVYRQPQRTLTHCARQLLNRTAAR